MTCDLTVKVENVSGLTTVVHEPVTVVVAEQDVFHLSVTGELLEVEVFQVQEVPVVSEGLQGPTGPQGAVGPIGPTGPVGPTGPQGELNAVQHAQLRQLVHLKDGPWEEWTSGAVRKTLPAGSPFPTLIVWYTDALLTHKIVAKLVSYNANKTAASIQWSLYHSDGVTVIKQITDTVSYSSVFETLRTRTVS